MTNLLIPSKAVNPYKVGSACISKQRTPENFQVVEAVTAIANRKRKIGCCAALVLSGMMVVSAVGSVRRLLAVSAQQWLRPPLQVVFEKVASRVLKEVANRCGFKDEIQKLQRSLRMIQAVLEDAEERQAADKALKLWLTELKEVAYDADDLHEEFAPEAMLLENGNTFTKQVSNTIPSLNPVIAYLRKLPELTQIRKRLDVLLEERSCFKLKEKVGDKDKSGQKRETGSFVVEPEVIGREEDKEKIIQILLLTTERRAGRFVSVIPIMGLGGIGKTTLAQTVYNDERVMRNFELRMWVSVNDDFGVRKILNLMMESANRRRCDDLLGMDALQFQLRDLLLDKRYLLVLDDVWNEDEDEWEKLKTLLNFGAEESKVIVTTRSAKAAEIVGTVSSHHLEGLSDDECWTLFKQRAFSHGQQDKDNPNLFPIGKQIVKKCGGVTLAAKTLGGLMRSKREPTEWLCMQESDMWNVCEEENGILPVLRLSYSRLPSHLKGCFMYCSIFPKNYVIKKDKLIHLWIAEGLIQQIEERKSLEEIGNEYFHDLMWMLFFEDVKKNEFGDVIECRMHGIIHDLAKSVAGEEYFVFEGGCMPRNLLNCEALYEAKKLRTLILLYPKGGLGEVPTKLFSSFKYLRVLDLDNFHRHRSLQTLPLFIVANEANFRGNANLMDLSRLQLKGELTVRKLENSLEISECHSLSAPPPIISELISLKHLSIENCSNISLLAIELRHLSSLEHLTIIYCPSLVSLPNEWQNLSMLRSWCILSCPQLSFLPDSIQYVRTLQNLEFHACPGLNALPEWILNLSLLRSLAISDCPKITSLLDNLQCLSNLQRLSIQEFPRFEEHYKKNTDKPFSILLGEVPFLLDSALKLLRYLCYSNVFDATGKEFLSVNVARAGNSPVETPPEFQNKGNLPLHSP
ncbi:putative disease resistance protein RGA1 [Hibiscus syriacus]|uniref:putative disease resistance protein RGA1 n=1 Tax=Hibiscus syriacus TaxID=106335 RepID=UPI00192443A1|nr:putative disease resistance protein RGA1 [Hibiscus syriacus]